MVCLIWIALTKIRLQSADILFFFSIFSNLRLRSKETDHGPQFIRCSLGPQCQDLTSGMHQRKPWCGLVIGVIQDMIDNDN